ncbi:alpha/beta hydrolase [Sphingomonas suaedae]|uniref:Alpha/beta hydrolase n=1 Tax=Sphingomonas suaedae TaxID=2599297 RepID=A0A518RHM0_9SPHN|nr:alpha/beta hydrolase [Sphingomonas suaedae]QDX26936.1 alpha/beta hydrolase [Sphingomonas suaedae]
MPAFFIHGVPETHDIWTPVIERLSRDDIIAENLPGFCAPSPDGFAATKEAYVDRLIDRIEAVGTPVDLVMHDWGCILGVRVASLRPALIRSWTGGGGSVDPAQQRHPLAKVWQTPGLGEAFFAELDRDVLIERLRADGVPYDLSPKVIGRIDATMADSILRLYRSALTVGKEWQPDLARITAPGLVHGRRDKACLQSSAERLAADTKSPLLLFDAGHWFPLESPAEVAAALEAHWAKQ